MWLRGILTVAAFLCLLWLEKRRPLRGSTENKARRLARNFCVAVLAAATVQLAEVPVSKALSTWVEQHRIGLLPRLPLPPVLKLAFAVALLDYTLYLWHVLTHKSAFLWRFHEVHHADRDLDASTALRFHFGELVLSVPWRAAQIAAIGVPPDALALWQTLLLLSILFHHSNVRLPLRLESWIARVVVTPRMHGIHHSVVVDERNSNWSSGLSVWDWLHGTFRFDVPQEQIVIGVEGEPRPEDVTLPKMLALPFRLNPRAGPAT
jgi:sterol desaturase/sphingolipid hydroxylase (fatty acid hydroxylase superfamily)